MKKLETELVRRTLENYGLKLLSDEFYGTDIEMDIEDAEGYRYFTTLTRLRNSKFVVNHKFSSKNKNAIYNCNLYIKNNVDNGTMLIHNKNFIDNEPVEFLCGVCGEVFWETWKCFYINNPRHTCQKCSRAIAKRCRLRDFEEIKNLVNAIGFEINEKEYKNMNTAMNVYDESGYIGFSCVNAILANSSFAKFHIRNPNTIYNINNYCELNNVKCRVNENQIYYKELQKLEFIYVCGKHFHTNLDNFFAGKNRCSVCSKSKSRYEIAVEEWLESNGVEYKFQKSYKDCRNKNPLPFDFYIENFGLIEVDGEEHFYPVKFGGITEEKANENFEKTIINDNIKNEYCKDNQINLLRISYVDILSNKYKEILKKNLRFEE